MRYLLIAAAVAFSNAAGAAGNADKGKNAYVQHGCWQCHGFVGQGGVTGPKLAPNPMSFDAMNAFVRNSNRAMPPYQKAVLSDSDLADIHAYLQSIPQPADLQDHTAACAVERCGAPEPRRAEPRRGFFHVELVADLRKPGF